MVLAADLVRRGASILQEACPRCGSVQIKYKGKVYCTSEDDLESLRNPSSVKETIVYDKVEEHKPVPAASQAADSLRKMLEEKLNNLSKQLESTTSPDEQTRILDLMSKYLETLEKAKRV
jgi:uncharacterized Zn finger protein (UPF0148 family)